MSEPFPVVLADIRADLFRQGKCGRLWHGLTPPGGPVISHLCASPQWHDGPCRCACRAATPRRVKR